MISEGYEKPINWQTSTRKDMSTADYYRVQRFIKKLRDTAEFRGSEVRISAVVSDEEMNAVCTAVHIGP
jgi:hypothetical protein